MKNQQTLILTVVILGLSALACNLGVTGNPALPTGTPTPPDLSQPAAASPTPTITPTPEPGARVESGDRAYFNGDWDLAQQEYTIAIESNQDEDLQAAAYLGLGRVNLQIERYQRALEALNTALSQFPNSAHRAELYFAAAQVYEALEQHEDAITAYQQYLELRPGLLESYVYTWIGDHHLAAGNYQGAIDNYSQAIQAPHIGDTLDLNVHIGEATLYQGDQAAAMAIYQDVFSRTNNDYTKASMLYRMGSISISQGLVDDGHQYYLQAVENYPLSYDSYLALIELVDDGVPVSDLDRGLVDYFAGQYSAASSAFERYISTQPEEHLDTAYYYNGLTLMAVGAYEDAINEFQKIVDRFPGTEHWADAYDEISYIQWTYMDEYEEAVETIEDMLELAPENPQAPELLYFAGRIAERDNKLDKAAKLWEHLGIAYSNSEYAYDAFFQAGILRYRMRQYPEAVNHFQSALGLALNSEDQARAHFWVGKSYEQLGDQQSSFTGYQQALESDVTGYYSERAREALEYRDPFEPPVNYRLDFDEEAERQNAETWLRLVFGISDDVDLDDMTPLLLDDRFTRGTELWNLGLYNEARAEFESLRTSVSSDPLNSYRLGCYLIDIGLYRSGIFAIREVLNLAGLDDAGTLRAPAYFNYLRFGLYYSDIVLPAAQEYNLHPLFLFAVIRQESLFEGFVTSTAGARGLMQIIPATGENLYNRTGWPAGYKDKDLYRPLVNINFGASYFASQRNAFQDLFIALAAYNGGPGNANAWSNLSNGDPDLYVEVVRFAETRRYMRGVYEQYEIYKQLYGIEE